MSVLPETTQNNEHQSIPNLDLAYEYTKMLLEARSKSLDNLNTRLGTFLAFGGVSLRFGIEMPDKCLSCLILKVLVISFSATSIGMCAIGLIAKQAGVAIRPRKLMEDEWFYQANPKVIAFITNTLVTVVEDFENVLIEKGKRLKAAIVLLLLAAICLSVSTVIASFFKVCVSDPVLPQQLGNISAILNLLTEGNVSR